MRQVLWLMPTLLLAEPPVYRRLSVSVGERMPVSLANFSGSLAGDAVEDVRSALFAFDERTPSRRAER